MWTRCSVGTCLEAGSVVSCVMVQEPSSHACLQVDPSDVGHAAELSARGALVCGVSCHAVVLKSLTRMGRSTALHGVSGVGLLSATGAAF